MHPAPPARGRRRRGDRGDRRGVAHQRRPADPRRRGALRAGRRRAPGPGRERRDDHARPPARRHRRARTGAASASSSTRSRATTSSTIRTTSSSPGSPTPATPQGGDMNPKLTAVLLIVGRRAGQPRLHGARIDLQLPGRARRAGRRRARLLPRARGRGQHLVHRAGAVRRAARADRDRRRAARRRARAMRIAVPVGIAAAVVQVIGLLRWPILVPGYAADGDTDAFRTAERHPRHGDRRDARLRAHGRLDRAGHRRARAQVRRPLVRGARRRGRGAGRRRRPLAARPAGRRRGELHRLRALQRLADRVRRRAARARRRARAAVAS